MDLAGALYIVATDLARPPTGIGSTNPVKARPDRGGHPPGPGPVFRLRPARAVVDPVLPRRHLGGRVQSDPAALGLSPHPRLSFSQADERRPLVAIIDSFLPCGGGQHNRRRPGRGRRARCPQDGVDRQASGWRELEIGKRGRGCHLRPNPHLVDDVLRMAQSGSRARQPPHEDSERGAVSPAYARARAGASQHRATGSPTKRCRDRLVPSSGGPRFASVQLTQGVRHLLLTGGSSCSRRMIASSLMPSLAA
jgi:hypothetical protein